MASKSLTGSVQSTALEKNLGKTIVNRYYKRVDKVFQENLGNSGDNFVVEILNNLISDVPELRTKLIDLYNRNFGMHKNVNDIPDDIKAVQGAMLDGLVFGYDPESRTAELYTMNAKLLFGMDVDVTFIDNKVLDKNKIGEYKAYRLDITYKDGSKSFEFKAVNHRKKLDDSLIYVPYLSIIRGMKLIEHFISSGSVIKLTQNVAGVEKIRVVTLNAKILGEFCDDPTASEFLQCEYFPLKAMFYAPVVGAPSTTAMVTKVNLFDLNGIAKVRSRSDLKKMGIFKPTNPIRILIGENTVIQVLEKMHLEDPDAYTALLDSYPHNDDIFNGDTKDGSEVSPVMVSKYMHQISESDLEKVFDLTPGVKEEMGRKSFLMSDFRIVYKVGSKPMGEEDLRALLRGNICKILCRKDDCTTYSVIGTNNFRILSKIYGKGYYGKYESLGARVSAMLEELLAGRPLKGSCADNGLDYSVVSTLISNGESTLNAESFKQAYADATGVKTRKSSGYSNPGSVMLRQCFANRTSDGTVTDYYRTVNVDKILQVAIVSEEE